MSVLEQLRELANARSILGDMIEEHAHFGLVMACEYEVNRAWSELVGDIEWKRPRFANVNITIQHRDRRVRHRRIRREMERHLLATTPNADVRSTSAMRTLFNGYANAQIETEDQLAANLFNAMLTTDLVPYTDDGIAVVENAIRETLAAHAYDNIEVTAVPTSDHQLEVTYSAEAQRAVHTITISGTVDF